MKVDLSERNLTEIPPDVTSLDLSNNSLTRLRRPPETGRLTQLTILNLGNNQLMSLPPEIGQLTQLTTLDLTNNPIRILPDSVQSGDAEGDYYSGFTRLPKWNHPVNVIL